MTTSPFGGLKSRILVCGGRYYADRQYVYHILSFFSQWFVPDFCIIQGEARGADRLAKEWAVDHGHPVLCVPANWKYYGHQAAGPVRNTWMLRYANPDLVVAFPGGNGTANMLAQAANWKIDTFAVRARIIH